jgi:hypothetical protein
VSSVGLKRFNLLGSYSSNSAGVSSLECVVSISRYFILRLVISVLTVGINDCHEVIMMMITKTHGDGGIQISGAKT